ncbi:MAG: LytTR family DNA-binding domain-containing protein [Planctomycetota bacterium]
MTLRTLIVDDEQAARDRLRRLLGDVAGVVVIGDADSGPAALEAIDALHPDLVFLDVQMPGMDGLAVVEALRGRPRAPLIVFATAYEEHAMAAFDAHAVSYLLKPIDRERLAAAVERCRQIAQSHRVESELTRIADALQRREVAGERLVVRTRRGLKMLQPADIVCVSAEGSVVHVHTAQEVLRADQPVRELEAVLPDPPFFRARRGVLVNLDRVQEIQHGFRGCFVLVLADAGATEIALSERQSKVLRERLGPKGAR